MLREFIGVNVMATYMDEECRKILSKKSNPVREKVAAKCPIIKHVNRILDENSGDLNNSTTLRGVLVRIRKDKTIADHPDYSALSKVLDRLLRGYT